uniref:Uncharacterized protein n=1 Tax=Arion vulgaris TaxID=1028688 RepID=A0A0B6YWX9_9EUPU
MSPPKVSLSGKGTLKHESDELTSDNGDGAEFPSVIFIETEHRARNFRRQLKRQRCKRVICGVTLVITVALAALLTLIIVNVVRKHHRTSWKCKSGKGLPTNVRVDNENQLIHASHDHDDQSQTAAFEILHEYVRHLVAYKNVENDTCYIDRLDETFEQGFVRWNSYETGDKYPQALIVISQPIEKEVLLHIGDTHIYGHCNSSKSLWVKEIDIEEVTSEMTVIYL